MIIRLSDSSITSCLSQVFILKHNMLPSPKTLYLCYFGLREPLVQTQVLPYLREIQKGGTEISVLTFEPEFKKTWTSEQIETERKKLADENIDWSVRAYHKRPSAPATLYDVLTGAYFAWKMLRRENIDILHARVHVPMLMAVLARKFSRRKPKIIFDIRGFFPEEYTDAGVWKENSFIYRLTKRVERWLMKEADGFIVLTTKARQILFPESKETGFDKLNRPVEVIPCCINSQRFEAAEKLDRDALRRELKMDGKRVFVYVGSFGGWYLTEEMLDFFQLAREQNPQTFALILTQRDKEKVVENLRKRGFSDDDFLVESVSPTEIPKFLKASDVALSFIKACYSKQSSSPTKIAEYLAGGLPIIINSGVGDLDALVETNKVGIVLQGFGKKDYAAALKDIDVLLQDEGLQIHCQKVAYEQFDLENVAGARYRKIYQRLLNE